MQPVPSEKGPRGAGSPGEGGTCRHPDLGLLASRTVRRPRRLSRPGYGGSLEQPEQTEATANSRRALPDGRGDRRPRPRGGQQVTSEGTASSSRQLRHLPGGAECSLANATDDDQVTQSQGRTALNGPPARP